MAVEITAPTTGEHVGTQFEIWRVAGGEPGVLAWSAEVLDPTQLTISIEEGTFSGITSSIGFLDWKDYGVRARYKLAGNECTTTESAGGFGRDTACCNQWSAWSETRVFRITDGSPEIFDANQIRDMEIEIGPESWASIDAEARPPGCVPYTRNYYEGNAVIDGERFDGVGVRAKGGCGSSRNLDGKTSFKVNLSWDDPAVGGCPETRRRNGLKRYTFNNQVQDRSFTHERVAYHFWELMGVPVPRVAHTRLRVNGEPWGLYLNIETIDRRMLSRNFGSGKGGLYEGTYRCDLLPENVPPGLEETFCIQAKFLPDECSSTPDPGDDPLNYDPIRAFAEAIEALPDGGFYPAITELVEWEKFLSLWAADTMLGHWDGYTFDIINNYRVYHDPTTGKWTVIPTGADQTLTSNREIDPFDPDALLARRCLDEAPCEAAFVKRLQEAIAAFEAAELGTYATQVAAQIRPDVEADPRKEGTVEQFDNQQATLQNFIANRPDVVRAYIDNR